MTGKKILHSDVKVGDFLIPDEGFTCVTPGVPVEVKGYGNHLYFECSAGNHSLDGQYDQDGYLTGFYPPESGEGLKPSVPESGFKFLTAYTTGSEVSLKAFEIMGRNAFGYRIRRIDVTNSLVKPGEIAEEAVVGLYETADDALAAAASSPKTDKKPEDSLPARWALDEATKRGMGYGSWDEMSVESSYVTDLVVALAAMIEKHEKPPTQSSRRACDG